MQPSIHALCSSGESFDASASCTVSTAQAAFAIEGSGLSRITTLRGVTVGPRASPVTTDDAVMLRGVTAGPRECPVNTNAELVARIESMALISRVTAPLIFRTLARRLQPRSVCLARLARLPLPFGLGRRLRDGGHLALVLAHLAVVATGIA